VDRTPPESDEVEISLFGPGYGECVLVHLGRGDWMMVDSCRNTGTQVQPALDYLAAMGVNIAAAIRLTVISHWDDDHIGGLSDVIQATPEAEVWCSTAMTASREFLALVEQRETLGLALGSGAREFRTALDLIVSRGSSVQFAIASSPLYARPAHNRDECVVTALSPSSQSFLAAQQQLARIVSEPALIVPRLRQARPNHNSIALWIAFPAVSVVLGADLEVTRDNRTGWEAVVTGKFKPRKRASLIKLPHHGSANAHSPNFWNRMLVRRPAALVTPWRSVLPIATDVARICNTTSEAYITRRDVPGNFYRYEPAVGRAMRAAMLNRRPVGGPFGHVRARHPMLDKRGRWSIEVTGDAAELDCEPRST
jgi:beta-lactamase superfamily II metal-dependent hydrolase